MRMIVTRMQSGHVGAILIHLSGKTWLGVGPDQWRTQTEPWGIRRLPPQRRQNFSGDNSQVRSAWRLLQAGTMAGVPVAVLVERKAYDNMKNFMPDFGTIGARVGHTEIDT
eukprot:585910-Pyramimonas_sp.AAC.1